MPAHSLPAPLPSTPEEWQGAVDAAWFALTLDACYQYGLLVGPCVDVGRCNAILAHGKVLGYAPDPDLLRKVGEGR